MAIDRTYRCDLCKETLETGSFADPRARPIGLYFVAARVIVERPWREVERHICAPCLSSLQALEPRCGAGFNCAGGPKCTSDHK